MVEQIGHGIQVAVITQEVMTLTLTLTLTHTHILTLAHTRIATVVIIVMVLTMVEVIAMTGAGRIQYVCKQLISSMDK